MTQRADAHRKMDLLAAVEMRMGRKAGKSARQLAAEYGVDISHVYGVLRGDAFAPQIMVPVDDETYLSLHRASKRSRRTIGECAAKILRKATK